MPRVELGGEVKRGVCWDSMWGLYSICWCVASSGSPETCTTHVGTEKGAENVSCNCIGCARGDYHLLVRPSRDLHPFLKKAVCAWARVIEIE